MSARTPRLVLAGLVGTLVMTAIGLYAAPMMGMPAMNPAEMLAGPMGGSLALGWMAHLMIGVVLALVYGKFLASRLPGPAPIRGALFAMLPWLMAQVVVMPMMGMPLFSGSMMMAGGSLIGHLMYGMVVGALAGTKCA